ncbi:hypothetical protein [Pseudomonas sp.]|uniref:hypothetical protein n=1 Tax=Pseudomonas sp. TaxID=306 RepID=UPI0028A6FF9C|nr:hypothetical protein [Pseudomonas sp.]
MGLLELINKYNGTIAVVVSLVVAFCALYHYVSVKNAEERSKQYDRYHKLLEDLNISPRGDDPFVDRQVAVIYELRRFPEYYPVSLRILNASLSRWKQYKQNSAINEFTGGRVNTVFDEAMLTIRYIERKKAEKSYLCMPEDD